MSLNRRETSEIAIVGRIVSCQRGAKFLPFSLSNPRINLPPRSILVWLDSDLIARARRHHGGFEVRLVEVLGGPHEET
jgi:hypothetical protein